MASISVNDTCWARRELRSLDVAASSVLSSLSSSATARLLPLVIFVELPHFYNKDVMEFLVSLSKFSLDQSMCNSSQEGVSWPIAVVDGLAAEANAEATLATVTATATSTSTITSFSNFSLDDVTSSTVLDQWQTSIESRTLRYVRFIGNIKANDFNNLTHYFTRLLSTLPSFLSLNAALVIVLPRDLLLEPDLRDKYRVSKFLDALLLQECIDDFEDYFHGLQVDDDNNDQQWLVMALNIVENKQKMQRIGSPLQSFLAINSRRHSMNGRLNVSANSVSKSSLSKHLKVSVMKQRRICTYDVDGDVEEAAAATKKKTARRYAEFNDRLSSNVSMLQIIFYCEALSDISSINIASQRHFCINFPRVLRLQPMVSVVSVLRSPRELFDSLKKYNRNATTVLIFFRHNRELFTKARRLSPKNTLIGLQRAQVILEWLNDEGDYDFVLPDSWSVEQAVVDYAPQQATSIVRNIEMLDEYVFAQQPSFELPRRDLMSPGDLERCILKNLNESGALKNDARLPRLLMTSATSATSLTTDFRLCIHGNAPTINLFSHEMQQMFIELHESPHYRLNFTLVVLEPSSVNRGASNEQQRQQPYRIERHSYVSFSYAISLLSSCDVGLVPHGHILQVPWSASKTNAGKLGGSFNAAGRNIDAEWVTSVKVTANGGRAFIFAQLGVPLIATLEVETSTMLATALGAKVARRCLAYTARGWLDSLLYLLIELSDEERKRLGVQLQQWALENLSLQDDAKDFVALIHSIA